MTKLEKLLALIDDIELTEDRAVIRMSKDVVVISEGSTVTLNRGLSVAVARFRHDNPVRMEDAFRALDYAASSAFVEDLTAASVEHQRRLTSEQAEPAPYLTCPDGSCTTPVPVHAACCGAHEPVASAADDR